MRQGGAQAGVTRERPMQLPPNPLGGQTLRILFRRSLESPELWIGQCLDFDIAVQAKTVADAHYALQKAIVGRIFFAQARGIEDPFQGVPPAPSELWTLYETQGARLELRFETFHRDSRAAAPLIPMEARVA